MVQLYCCGLAVMLQSKRMSTDDTQAAPAFSHLTLTGGAIGCGPPLAVGAAIAQPQSTVINFQVFAMTSCRPMLLSARLLHCLAVTAPITQADGSALYSLQALWTQAREELHIITIICANRAYAILKVRVDHSKDGARLAAACGGLRKRCRRGTPELSRLSCVHVQMELARQGIQSGPQAQALTELSSPTIDWVLLGQGFGVHSQRATSLDSFCEAMTAALRRSGPSLIEAVL